jgi:hypothetical protein
MKTPRIADEGAPMKTYVFARALIWIWLTLPSWAQLAVACSMAAGILGLCLISIWVRIVEHIRFTREVRSALQKIAEIDKRRIIDASLPKTGAPYRLDQLPTYEAELTQIIEPLNILHVNRLFHHRNVSAESKKILKKSL